ncbi:MAG: 50S ribosomal protein L19 [Candidatus Komeilibacteria bacterium]|jgi:large subunit ribosomal protein L19|nr:50S ribosomal protein L19 [Candidatus Komeilibacteria bacterium]
MSEDKKTTEKEVKKPTENKDKVNGEARENGLGQKKAVTEKTPELKPGMTVRVHETIREKNAKGEEKERIQVFEGIILAKKHKKEIGATITVRKVSGGIGVEKIFPINSPLITKVETIKQAKVSRAKLGYLREYKKKLKETKLA